MLERVAGLHHEAALPKYSKKTLETLAKEAPVAVNRDAPAFGRKAVLYATCYGDYNDPSVGLAARAVLARNGVETEILHPHHLGPQRPVGPDHHRLVREGRAQPVGRGVGVGAGREVERGVRGRPVPEEAREGPEVEEHRARLRSVLAVDGGDRDLHRSGGPVETHLPPGPEPLPPGQRLAHQGLPGQDPPERRRGVAADHAHPRGAVRQGGVDAHHRNAPPAQPDEGLAEAVDPRHLRVAGRARPGPPGRAWPRRGRGSRSAW